MKKYMLFILCLLFYSCSDSDKRKSSIETKREKKEIKLPNDIRWVTNSSEYQILCKQIYENAWDNLSSDLKAANSYSAIVMDLDETVLDNSKYQVGLTKKMNHTILRVGHHGLILKKLI